MEENKVLKKRNPEPSKEYQNFPKAKKLHLGTDSDQISNNYLKKSISNTENGSRDHEELLKILHMLALNQINFELAEENQV